jgi:hypothetical protein
MLAAAKASDTMFYPGRQAGQPTRSLINQVKEVRGQGGSVLKGNLRRDKTVVEIVGHRDFDELNMALNACSLAIGNRNNNQSPFVLRNIQRNPTTNMSFPAMQAQVRQRQNSRMQPSKKPRTAEEIVNEQYGQSASL